MADKIVDIAIVGGGVSGIYTAWRLATASPAEVEAIRGRIGGSGPLKIEVHERGRRLGGRLLSAIPDTVPYDPEAGDPPGTVAEIGGMRFLNTQPYVSALVQNHLKLAHYEQTVGVPENLAYLRGHRLLQGAVGAWTNPLYFNVTEDERVLIGGPKGADPAPTPDPTAPLFAGALQALPEDLREKITKGQIKGMDLLIALSEVKIDGVDLWKMGFWNLLSRHVSHEARQLAITMIGYDVLGANANAVDIIAENFDFTKDTKYYLMNEGYESVVWHLAEEFIAAGGTVVMNHELAAVGDGSGETPFSLTFQQGEALAARAVVLAMPPAAIRRLNRSGPLLDPTRAPGVPGLLSSVSGIPLYKLFLVYDRPWWNEHAGLSAGRSITDLPVRQCYYWRTQPGGPSMIMAYNDLDSTSFWGGYQLGAQQVGNTVTDKGAASRPYVLPGFSDPAARSQEYLRRKRDNWTNHVAPQAMVMEMHHQLMEMHGVPGAPDPIDAAFMDWMNEPYGGAVHFWNPGCKSHELARTIVQPVDGLNAFIVGEAFSNGQTWVEGALQTSELLLQERLGLSAPDWLSEGQGGGA